MDLILFYKNLFAKLNVFFNVSDLDEFNEYLDEYLIFLNDYNYNSKIKDIFSYLEKSNFNINNYFNFNISVSENYRLWSLIIFISINKVSLTSGVKDIKYLSMDDVLNNVVEKFSFIFIFYYSKEPIQNDLVHLRGVIFKLIKILDMEKIVFIKRYFSSNKTRDEVSFNFKNLISSDFSHIKISSKPFKLLNTGDNFYLVGSFFTFVKKIFIENVQSDFFFKLNDMGYINKMIHLSLFLNVHDLNDIIKIFQKKGFSIENILTLVDQNNKLILDNLIKISNERLSINKDLFGAAKNYLNIYYRDGVFLTDIHKLSNDIISIFYNYSKKFLLERKNYDLDDIGITDFVYILYGLFKHKFSSVKARLDFKNLDDYLSWHSKTNFLGLNLEDLAIEDSKKRFKPIESLPFKIDSEINSDLISFITFLMLYTKKEIDDILIKNFGSKKKRVISVSEIIKEDLNNSDMLLCVVLSSFLKFDIKSSEDARIYKKWSNIRELNFLNQRIYSETSKLLHLYDIFLLEKYIKFKKFENKIDEFGNIQIYFMFFFDFRGRIYYNSPVSPTSNKFCRLIFNYGPVDLSKKFVHSELSIIIGTYISIISIFKRKVGIVVNSDKINEIVFWLMISIGKISINKDSDDTYIINFLSKAIEMLEKTDFLDDFDLAEFNYYLKIAGSLNDKIVLRRCLIKDATASFFQNLIRVLGCERREILKIANLLSKDKWYDWYSHILLLWNNLEKKNGLYNEKINNLFVRKTIKQTVMTIPYEGSLLTCFDYFSESVRKKFDVDISISDDVGKAFIRFYKFVYNQIQNSNLFIKSAKDFSDHFKKILKDSDQIVLTSRVNDSSNLTYYKTKTKHFDFIIRYENTFRRVIKNYSEIDKNNIDAKKTATAFKANLIHFVDAMLVRDINNNVFALENRIYLTIHDSFMVDFSEISTFILIANKQVNQPIFKENYLNLNSDFFSIFVFL